MKKLLLCRHAKSSWDYPELADHLRPLAKRGLRDAPIMAERLLEQGIYPELILTSDAVRARETAAIFAKKLGISPQLLKEQPQLYPASTSSILNLVKSVSDNIQTVFVFGHNPGFNDFIHHFGGNIGNLPTSGVYGIKFDTIHWAEIHPKNGEFWYYDYPKRKRN
jgi:phosphohistidine phosphatase